MTGAPPWLRKPRASRLPGTQYGTCWMVSKGKVSQKCPFSSSLVLVTYDPSDYPISHLWLMIICNHLPRAMSIFIICHFSGSDCYGFESPLDWCGGPRWYAGTLRLALWGREIWPWESSSSLQTSKRWQVARLGRFETYCHFCWDEQP